MWTVKYIGEKKETTKALFDINLQLSKYAGIMWKVLTHSKASLLKIFNNIKHINWRPKSAGHLFPAK